MRRLVVLIKQPEEEIVRVFLYKDYSFFTRIVHYTNFFKTKALCIPCAREYIKDIQLGPFDSINIKWTKNGWSI